MVAVVKAERIVTIKITERGREALRRHAEEWGMKQYKLAEQAIVSYYEQAKNERAEGGE